MGTGPVGLGIGVSPLSAGAAAAYLALVSRPLKVQRKSALDAAAEVLRQMRLEGRDEVAISRFVAEFSGPHWEELFELLFDYDLLRQMRSDLSGSGKLRGTKRFQPWRDSIVDRLDARLKALQEDRQRRVWPKSRWLA